MFRSLILLLFFISGAAGLVYEVTWARSLGLVFGASHLAVTTVLAVYMGGLALGSALLGRLADRTSRPLRLYGLLELGVALSALLFLGLMEVYPSLYPPIARLSDENGPYLTAVRTGFAVAAMIIPTTLMGGTLPVLARFVARPGEGVARHVSFLYAFNTAGAVAGTLLAGFFLIRAFGVQATLLIAAATSALVGVVSLSLGGQEERTHEADAAPPSAASAPGDLTVLITTVGIAVSGFCALGYEILWTRMLTLVAGTSVYSFTLMLVAFLAGIGAGSHAFSLVRRWAGTPRSAARLFAASQVAIGLTALAATVLMGQLPSIANRLRALLVAPDASVFLGQVVSSFGAAVTFMFVPAFFMGLAFPLAGAASSARSGSVGTSIGRLLTANTVGAILGSIVSGFVLVYFLGIERSLQLLVIVNVGMGLAVFASAHSRRRWVALVAAATCLLLVLRAALPGWGRAWDEGYFATYVNSSRSVDTPEMARHKLSDVDVVYYHEGVNETVSVIRSRGGEQFFTVNGRPEASTALTDVQLQRALGHIPMLLHPNPRRVFVLGTGSGMTLGATAVHPEVERVVLAEIEEGVLGVARSFAAWNHHVLDNPKLHIVFNDGRNHLATTREQFDVITADPIHPWSGGAGYLYTAEYFHSVAGRLAPGGIASQWLPLYELTARDVKTVVRTWAGSFAHTMLWLTYYDAVLIGSNDPIVIDEEALAGRMSVAAIKADLSAVEMGTAEDLLSFFLMGTSGTRAFGQGGDLNTDDNVVLEFTAPESQGVAGLDAKNAFALRAGPESLLPFLVPGDEGAKRSQQEERWSRHLDAARLLAEAHARFLLGDRGSPALEGLLAKLRERDPGYAPLRFLLGEKEFWLRSEPALVREIDLPVGLSRGARGLLRISAVRQYVGRSRVLVSFVDNVRQEVYGQRFIDGQYAELDGAVERFVIQTLASFQEVASRSAASPPGGPPEQDLSNALRLEAATLVGRLPGSEAL